MTDLSKLSAEELVSGIATIKDADYSNELIRRLKEAEALRCCGNCNTQSCCKMPHNADECCDHWQPDSMTREERMR